MLARWPWRTVATAILLTAFGAAALAAGARPEPGAIDGSTLRTTTRAASASSSAVARVFHAAPFRSGVPVLSYYNGVPLVPGSITDAQALALVDAGILPPYHQTQGPGRTIPLPGSLLNQFRQRERFLNALIGGENRLIKVQANTVLLAARVVNRLAQVSRLIGVLPPGQAAPLLQLYGVLSSRLNHLKLSLALNDRALIVGLRNEVFVFNLLKRVASGSPDVAFYRFLIARQARLVDFLVQDTETPFVAQPLSR